jgi:hypothetical protein
VAAAATMAAATMTAAAMPAMADIGVPPVCVMRGIAVLVVRIGRIAVSHHGATGTGQVAGLGAILLSPPFLFQNWTHQHSYGGQQPY